MTIWTKKQLIMDHILHTVFEQSPDSELEKILIHNGYWQPTDFIIKMDATLDGLAYPNDAKAMVKIMKGDAGLLKSFKRYAAYHAQQGTPFDTSKIHHKIRSESSTHQLSLSLLLLLSLTLGLHHRCSVCLILYISLI